MAIQVTTEKDMLERTALLAENARLKAEIAKREPPPTTCVVSSGGCMASWQDWHLAVQAVLEARGLTKAQKVNRYHEIQRGPCNAETVNELLDTAKLLGFTVEDIFEDLLQKSGSGFEQERNRVNISNGQRMERWR